MRPILVNKGCCLLWVDEDDGNDIDEVMKSKTSLINLLLKERNEKIDFDIFTRNKNPFGRPGMPDSGKPPVTGNH